MTLFRHALATHGRVVQFYRHGDAEPYHTSRALMGPVGSGSALGETTARGADGSPAVFTDYPEGAVQAAAPFAVLGFRSLELASLGFGDTTARRGSFAFSLDVYARSGSDAASGLALLAAKAQSESVRALLGGVKLSAAGTKPDRDGLTVTGAVLSGEALVSPGAVEDADIIDLNFTGTLIGV